MDSKREFDGQCHLIGCGKWADLWERHWGRENLDSTTRKNLDAMRLRGCPCRMDDEPAAPRKGQVTP